jgi:hypothetical protein
MNFEPTKTKFFRNIHPSHHDDDDDRPALFAPLRKVRRSYCRLLLKTHRNNNMASDDPLSSIIGNLAPETTENEPSLVLGPSPMVEEVLACQCSSWYPTFSNLSQGKRKNVTISTIILTDLPDDFQDYLLSDGLRLPLDATKLSSCAPPESSHDDDDAWSSDASQNDEDNNGSECSTPPKQFSFPELNQQLESAIAKLGGAVLPKLNWSAPKDATWVHGGSLKCQTPGDIYLLLKSSDFCLHDVLHALDDCPDKEEASASPVMPKMQLVLRKWCHFHPSNEFRCFVRHDDLLAISQRNHTQHYPHLSQDVSSWMTTKLLDFFYDTIQHVFAKDAVHNYVVDMYIDQKQRVWLVDFNVWGRSTDSLLLEWSELTMLDLEEEPCVRIVETTQQVRQDPLSSYRAPIDTVDLASMTRGDKTEFEEFMKQCQKPTQRKEDDEL